MLYPFFTGAIILVRKKKILTIFFENYFFMKGGEKI